LLSDAKLCARGRRWQDIVYKQSRRSGKLQELDDKVQDPIRKPKNKEREWWVAEIIEAIKSSCSQEGREINEKSSKIERRRNSIKNGEVNHSGRK
jgi:hypothetical protein